MNSYNRIFTYNFEILLGIGLWQVTSKDPAKVKFYSSFQFLSLFFLFSFVCLASIDLYLSLQDIRKLTFNLCGTVVSLMTFFRCISTLQQRPNMIKLTADLDRDPNRETAENARILAGAALEMKRVMQVVYIMGYSLILGWVLIPLADSNERRLPFQTWWPVNPYESPNYEIVYCYHALFCLYLIPTIFAVNTSVIGFVIRICAEYDILMVDIASFCWRCHAADCEIAPELKDVVRHHQKIIGFVKHMQRTFNTQFIIHIVTTTILLAAVGFDVILLSNSITNEFRFVVQMGYIFTAMADFFLLCSYGTKLAKKSEDVVNLMYGSEWYALPDSHKKCFAFMILRCQHVPRLLIGKIFTINLHLFLQVLKTTYNTIAVLWQLELN